MRKDIPHLPVGTVLAGGKYRIVRFIGAGGFGCTYEAEFVEMGTSVAIKEFYVDDFCDRNVNGIVAITSKNKASLVDKLKEKFVREARRLFKMSHPNIVRVSDILHENGTCYYMMDYIDGRSLQSVIDHEGPLSECRAVRYISQVMDALEYVHGENMLHLDIKPDNIMIDRKDNAILIDFGVSKQYDEVDGHNTSTIMGQTPGYAPLEQVGNRVRQFTPAADIYALGATLYTVLTGMAPPASPDLSSGDANLAPLPVGINGSTRQAILAMMQPTIKKRPQTIADARTMLLPDAGVITMPITEDRPKSKKWIWVAVVAFVILCGVCLFAYINSNNSNDLKIDNPIVASEQLPVNNGSEAESSGSDTQSVVEDQTETEPVAEAHSENVQHSNPTIETTTPAQVNPDFVSAQAIAYLDDNKMWEKDEMEKFPELAGLYDDLNCINYDRIINYWGPKLVESKSFTIKIVEHTMTGKNKKPKKKPYTSDGKITIMGWLNNVDP